MRDEHAQQRDELGEWMGSGDGRVAAAGLLRRSGLPHGHHQIDDMISEVKAMQNGFSPNRWLDAAKADRQYNGKSARKHLREIWDPTWAASLRSRMLELTGATQFTYVLAVTRLGKGGSADTSIWTGDPVVGPNLANNPAELWIFSSMWNDLKNDVTEQIEPSHVGRLAQLLKAAEKDV